MSARDQAAAIRCDCFALSGGSYGAHDPACPNAAAQDLLRWPCGCPKGMTPHGVGWKDCIFSDDQKEKWARGN